MTSYELSATNSQGETFTLSMSMYEITELLAALEEAAARAGAPEPGPAYQAFPVTGRVLEDALVCRFGELSQVDLAWFDGSGHWQTPGNVLSTDSARAEVWTVVWGDY